jgi:hypothetical protein
MNFETRWHITFFSWNMLEMWSQHAPNSFYMWLGRRWILCLGDTACLFMKRAPKLFYMWSPLIGKWILWLGDTACLSYKRSWNVIETCTKIALHVFGNEFCDWVTHKEDILSNQSSLATPHVCYWNVHKMWSKHARYYLPWLCVVHRFFPDVPWKDDTPDLARKQIKIIMMHSVRPKIIDQARRK